MPIPISNNLSSFVSAAMQHIENPNKSLGVLLEEVPADAGRTYQSYKRGGTLEGWERFRRETLSACVWLFGIPFFNKAGNMFCEKVLHIPVEMDFNNETISDVVNYLKDGVNPKGKDISELKKYLSSDFTLKKCSKEELVKSIKKSKGIITTGAVILNCLFMGVVIPKYNQWRTKRSLEEQRKNQSALNKTSFEQFKEKTSKNSLSFLGTNNLVQGIKNAAEMFPYMVENNNTFRLMSTDGPTLAGRSLTSRNKYEALENLIIDLGSVYFYNFCANHVRKFFCAGTKTPLLNPMVSDLFLKLDKDKIKEALEKVSGENKLTVDNIFEKEIADKIYDCSTFGKFTKINRHVTPAQKETVDNQVFNYLKKLSEKTGFSKGNEINIEEFRKFTKNYNIKSACFKFLGLAVAVFGLSTLLPKIAFKFTTHLTGKNEFTGIADFDEKNNVKKS